MVALSWQTMHGLDIAESIATHDAELCLPAFTKGKLSRIEAEKSRHITNVSIHIERAIGLFSTKLHTPS